jgi:DnaJ family protein A protein 2
MIAGQGMPSMRHHDHGNLYIQFDVKFPGKDEMQNLELLEKVLPPRIQQAQVPHNSMSEDFDLEDVDPRNQARAHGAAGLDEEDEDGIPQGAERMQCASQ